MKNTNQLAMASRRQMIKGLGAVALAPFFPATGMAMMEEVGRTDRVVHKVLTCNIRVALPEDDAIGLGWNARKGLCAGDQAPATGYHRFPGSVKRTGGLPATANAQIRPLWL